MEEIKELDDKYLVMKWDDVRNNLSLSQRRELVSIVQYNDKCRELKGKSENNYVVLNLDNNIDIQKLIVDLEAIEAHTTEPKIIQVNDIATVVVNAILCVENILKGKR